MASLKQIKANRENGKKGGPKTEAGKLVSSQNALKYGLLAKKNNLTGADRKEYEQLVVSALEELQPRSFLERELATIIINHAWKLRLVERVEDWLLRDLDAERIWATIAIDGWQTLQRYRTATERGLERTFRQYRAEQGRTDIEVEVDSTNLVPMHPDDLPVALLNQSVDITSPEASVTETGKRGEPPESVPVETMSPKKVELKENRAPLCHQSEISTSLGLAHGSDSRHPDEPGLVKPTRKSRDQDCSTPEEIAQCERTSSPQSGSPGTSGSSAADGGGGGQPPENEKAEEVRKPQYLTMEETLGPWREMKHHE